MPSVTETEPPSSGCSSLQQTLRTFSQRLIAAQRSIRPLEAIQWDEQVERQFLASGGRELPRVTRDDYRPLPFDPDKKQMEFQDLERDVLRTLGERDGAGRILVRMCREYTGLVRLLAYRGTRTFSTISNRLFGTALNGAGDALLQTLDQVSHTYPASCESEDPIYTAEDTRRELENRLSGCFAPEPVRFKIVDGIPADASAGTHYLKLRRDARYSDADMRMLEVHEGWVHLGTSFNARSQNACAFLSKGPPTSTRTQEGLAVLSELKSGAATHRRVNSLRQRVLGIRQAEEGADFRDVYRFLHESEPDDRECYLQTSRMFRGSLPSGAGPFTKDLSYAQGLTAVSGLAELDPRFHLLFCGKTAVEDLDTLEELSETGLLESARFIPPPFVHEHSYPQITQISQI
jgi:uncharacterized protein (TIGR02421 family)